MSLTLAAVLSLAMCRVVDGDGLNCQGERIRLVDIDAPEIAGHCPEERALALRSRDRLLEGNYILDSRTELG
jgi:endonuclease YncB( thermonuclease family)